MRRICVVVTTRGNIGKTKSLMREISSHPTLALDLVVGGALLNRQVDVLKELSDEGIEIARTLDYMLAGETPEAIGTSAALCTMRMVSILSELKPDVLFVVADRYEALSIAQAGLLCNIRIAHLEGGEVSGSIDERIRHAVTKLSHYHFPANQEAAERLIKMGEHSNSIVIVGSPSFDLLHSSADGMARLAARLKPYPEVDLQKPFLVFSQHPVATEFDLAARQFRTLAESAIALARPVIWIWPNNDAGASEIRKSLDWLRAQPDCPPLAVVTALPLEEYGAALSRTLCLVGNSSSGVREASFLGTPAVNIGTRQTLRGRGRNVIDVACEVEAIVAAVHSQAAHGRYQSDALYGDGQSGKKMADFLASYWPPLNKTIGY
jgi:UDP-hydrolysing UDP-N-acetyl-D-glucosamine 2-epimerase